MFKEFLANQDLRIKLSNIINDSFNNDFNKKFI